MRDRCSSSASALGVAEGPERPEASYLGCPGRGSARKSKEGSLEPAVLTALSAILGSAVGGSATLATAWLTQRTQGRREQIETEIRKREQLYCEFIAEGSKLTIEAFDHQLQTPERLTALYSIVSRIRLRCSEEVLAATERTATRIIEGYLGPNLSPEEVRQTMLARPDDPLKDFSEACRNELRMLERRRTRSGPSDPCAASGAERCGVAHTAASGRRRGAERRSRRRACRPRGGVGGMLNEEGDPHERQGGCGPARVSRSVGPAVSGKGEAPAPPQPEPQAGGFAKLEADFEMALRGLREKVAEQAATAGPAAAAYRRTAAEVAAEREHRIDECHRAIREDIERMHSRLGTGLSPTDLDSIGALLRDLDADATEGKDSHALMPRLRYSVATRFRLESGALAVARLVALLSTREPRVARSDPLCAARQAGGDRELSPTTPGRDAGVVSRPGLQEDGRTNGGNRSGLGRRLSRSGLAPVGGVRPGGRGGGNPRPAPEGLRRARGSGP